MWNKGTKAEPVTGDHLLFSFLTSNPNNILGVYHDRMPAIVPDMASPKAWLTAPSKTVHEFQKPLDDNQLMMMSDPSEFLPQQGTRL
jgi:putative SOS response-associated peptidase YedK